MGILGFLILVPLYTRRLRQFTHVRHFLAWCLPHFASLIWLFLAIDWLRLSSYDGVSTPLLYSLKIQTLIYYVCSTRFSEV